MKDKGKFKYNIGEVISDFDRDLTIIDCEYRPQTKYKRNKPYILNEKWYKYRCNKCGNEDWIREYNIYGKSRIGCNACCIHPKKLVYGINDISTTAPWMMDYIIDNEYCFNNFKYSKTVTSMKCPNCGKIIQCSAYLLFVNKKLPCDCKLKKKEQDVNLIKKQTKPKQAKKNRLKPVNYKYNIGDKIKDDKRNLEIIDRFIIKEEKINCNRPYISREKYYKYKCLNCGNEDITSEEVLFGRNCGCNVCCNPPRKIVKGINDISTTASWMMEYIIDEEYVYTNSKYSRKETRMRCPDCGRIHIKTAGQVCANHGLTCPCKDSWSYPNKYIYSLLEQIGINFKTEKIFDWSNSRLYDVYFEFNNKKIIIEMHGIQHYKETSFHKKKRSFEEEIENDINKKNNAINNGIDYYFVVNSSVSESEYIKQSIIESGLLSILDINEDVINWNECDKFASSNFYKTICEYHELNPLKDTKDLCDYFKVSIATIRKAIDTGLRNDWCSKTLFDTHTLREKNHMIDRGAKPIYCITKDLYFQSSIIASEILSNIENTEFHSRQIRQSIHRNNNYKNNKFVFISREEFNIAKINHPDKCYGTSFENKENSKYD